MPEPCGQGTGNWAEPQDQSRAVRQPEALAAQHSWKRKALEPPEECNCRFLGQQPAWAWGTEPKSCPRASAKLGTQGQCQAARASQCWQHMRVWAIAQILCKI